MAPVDTSFLNPKTQKFLANLPYVADWSKVTPQMLRSRPVCPLDVPEPPVTVKKLQIPDLKDGHPINVDVYRPKDAPSDAVLPVFIYLPGGGFTIPATNGHHYLVAKLAVEVNCVTILVNYSLSPEVKFPVALHECYSVVSYATNPETAAKLNIDPTRVALGGDSAGGNMTAGVTLLAKQRGDLKNSIKYQVLYYPSLGHSMEPSTFETYGEGYFLTKGLITVYGQNIISEEAKDNVLFAPNLATPEQLKDLPPALIVVAEADVLREDGEVYGRKLIEAGVPVASFRVNAVIHSFMANVWILTEETHLTIDMTASGIRRAFANK